MLRTRSFHRSTPNVSNQTASFIHDGRDTTTIVGRDELEERYLDLRDQHRQLRLEARSAREEVRQLHTKLSRLIEEKKRYFKHNKTDREVILEEQIFDLEQALFAQTKNNEKLKDRIQLIRCGGGGGGSMQQSNRFNVNEESLHSRCQQYVQTTTTKRVSSAYAHVTSRTDSGLGAGVINSSPVRSKIQLDLRPKSGILKNVQSRETRRDRSLELNEPKSTENRMPLAAAMLMRDAKAEIERLETIIVEQQSLLDSLLLVSNDNENGNDHDERNDHYVSDLSIPTNSGHQTISYELTTKTTTTATATTATTNGMVTSSNPRPDRMDNSTNQTHHDPISDLWANYQQLITRQLMSNDVRSLIESLYGTLRSQKQTIVDLDAKLKHTQRYIHAIDEKDKLIETLRKENIIMQQSLDRCALKCIDDDQQSTTNRIDNQQIRSQFKEYEKRITVYQNEISQLNLKLQSFENELETERNRNEQLRNKCETLQQLSDNDQLHMKHLKAKITRLSQIVFTDNSIITNTNTNTNSVEQRPENDHSSATDVTTITNNTAEPLEPIQIRLDQILDSLPMFDQK
ncbi:Protein fantom [Blomia tropicalis]|nr:Protein fantom [Blomia tropicalis]